MKEEGAQLKTDPPVPPRADGMLRVTLAVHRSV